MRRGGLVADLAIGVLEPFKAACKGSQILSANVTSFGLEAITMPELSWTLPNKMQIEKRALRARTSDLKKHFTGVSHPETGGDSSQDPQ
jgi:hypothetical protein